MWNPNEKRSTGAAMAWSLLLGAACAATLSGAAGGAELADAARRQDPAAVQEFIHDGADVNATSSDGSTALLWSAHWNDVATAKLLLEAGADANVANDFRMTPLSQACANASVELVKLLLRAGADPNLRIATGETPVMTCSRTGSVEAVNELIEFGADVNAAEPEHNQTSLMWAAAEQHPEIVAALIAAHANLTATTDDGFTPIHFAARIGDLESLKLLLDAGVDVNLQTQPHEGFSRAGAGYTPLLIAVLRAHEQAAMFLLDHGADPNVDATGMMPLHWAATSWEGYASNPVYGFIDPMSGIPDRDAKLRIVRALLDHGANVNARMTSRQPSFATGYTDAKGATPFLLAASVDDVEMMQLLLDAGADPTIQTETNATAIMAATGLNHGIGESLLEEKDALAAVDLLLKLGLDPKGATTEGENALFGPAYRGWNTLLLQLIDLGVDVNAVSEAGVTPYRAANGQGDRLGGVLLNTEGVEILLAHGADPTLGKICLSQNRCRAE